MRMLTRWTRTCLTAAVVLVITWITVRTVGGFLFRRQKAPIRTFTYTPRNRSDIRLLNELERIGLANYALPRVLDQLGELDVSEMSRQSRLFAEMHPIITQPVKGELGALLERRLYQYVVDGYGSVADLAKSFANGGRGIVITTGNLYFQFAVHIIRSLRVLHCTLPVEIWHAGEGDLNTTNTQFLSSFHGVRVRDIRDHFNISMDSWDVKPFAVLASAFSEVLLMDADSVFLQDPTLLFEDAEYKRDGALFFKDRSLFPGNCGKSHWILGLFPEPHSERIRNLRMLQAKSQYELEAGVVVINKQRHFHGLLNVGRLNVPGPIKNQIREETHGEKETFWIGLEMADEPYAFMPHLPGSLGTPQYNDKERVTELCGKLVHFDRAGRILWFNDAIAASKLPNDYFLTETMELSHFAREIEGEWEALCLRKCPFHLVERDQLDVINRLRQIYRFEPTRRKSRTFENNLGEMEVVYS